MKPTTKMISDEELGLLIQRHTQTLVQVCCYLYAFGQHLHYSLYKVSKWHGLFQGESGWTLKSLSGQRRKTKLQSKSQVSKQDLIPHSSSGNCSSVRKSSPRCDEPVINTLEAEPKRTTQKKTTGQTKARKTTTRKTKAQSIQS